MPVDRNLTCPDPAELANEVAIERRLTHLATSPRVRLERIGRSTRGRDLWSILVTHEDNLSRLDWHRARAIALQQPSDPSLPGATSGQPGEDVAFSALVAGASFGHEAAHTTAILECAEQLAWTQDAGEVELLRRLIVHHIPLMNPDGWAANMELWAHYRYAVGWVGTADGFYLNRDYLNLITPEAEAVVSVVERWRPIVVLDTHEDMFTLGVIDEAVCWCPSSTTGTAHEAPPRLKIVVEQLGDAIAREWDQRGFERLDRDMFGRLNRSASAGNLVAAGIFHGIPSVIIESGRAPGTQTFTDRVQQKVSAALALLSESARTAGHIASVIRQEASDRAHVTNEDALVFSDSVRDPSVSRRLVDRLLRHGVHVERVDTRPAAFVVPLGQPLGRVAEVMLTLSAENVTALAPALGIHVRHLRDSSDDDRRALGSAPRTRLIGPNPPVLSLELAGTVREAQATFAVANTVDGMALVNRLWQQRVPIRRTISEGAQGDGVLMPGDFLVAGVSAELLESMSGGLSVRVRAVAPEDVPASDGLSPPRIAIFAGQGVVSRGEMGWGEVGHSLRALGFGFGLVFADDLSADRLAEWDVLIVPDGDAWEMVNGWDSAKPWHQVPWEMPGQPRGIGEAGLEAMRSFVVDGGVLVGLAGGALLAGPGYAGLVDLDVFASGAGSTPVWVKRSAPESPLFHGISDTAVAGVPGASPGWLAYYHGYQYPTRGSARAMIEGPLFRVRGRATTLAILNGLPFAPGDVPADPAPFDSERRGAALATQSVGQGNVIITPLRLGFRGLWRDSQLLLGNIVLSRSRPIREEP